MQYIQQRSQASVKKAEAPKRAEINEGREISAQRMEVLAQQDKLKMLEEQRDVSEAEYKAVAEEEISLNA